MTAPRRNTSESELLSNMGWVHSLALGLVGDVHTADDIAQEVYVTAHERPPTRAGEGPSLRAWLRTATELLVRGARRRQMSRARRDRRASREEATASTVDVVARSQLIQRVSQAVLELPEPYRSTMLFRYLDGLKPQEIAARMEEPGATVRKRLSRGLEMLRARLERQGIHQSLLGSLLVSPIGNTVPAEVSTAGLTSWTGGIGLMLSKSKLATGVIALGAVALVCGILLEARPPAGLEPRGTGLETAEPLVSDPGQTPPEPLFARDEVPRTVLSPDDLGTIADEVTLVTIRVLDRGSGEPVPGAEVLYSEGSQDPSSPGADPELILRRSGAAETADPDGVVVVPVVGETMIVARSGNLYGQLQVRREPGTREVREERLFMEPDYTFSVQVEDSFGRPAIDVPLAIDPLFGGLELKFRTGVRGRSAAPNGVVRMAHAQVYWRQFWTVVTDSEPVLEGYAVKPRIPGFTGPGLVLDPRNPPQEPVVLRLPPTGSVVVQTMDATGQPFTGMSHTTIAIPAPEGTGPAIDQTWTVVEPNGRAVFEWVVCRTSYRASSSLNVMVLEQDFAGPLLQDDKVTVTLRADQELYELVGRALDAEGEPLEREELNAEWKVSLGDELPDVGRGRSFVTDDDGRFRIQVGRPEDTPTLTMLRMEQRGESSTKHPLRYEQTSPLPLQVGRNDLGSIRLTQGELLVSGQLWIDGEPARRPVELSVHRRVFRGGEADWSGNFDGSYRFLKDGRFDVRGTTAPGLHRLTVLSEEYLPVESVEFSPGEEGLQIELESAGRLVAVVRSRTSEIADYVRLVLTPTGGRAEAYAEEFPRVSTRIVGGSPFFQMSPWQRRVTALHVESLGESHEYSWASLWPGVYDLDVLLQGYAEPVATVRGIQVAAGRETQDPRLQNIDLREEISVFFVQLTDPSGEAIQLEDYWAPVVFVYKEGAGASLEGFTVEKGVAPILYRGRPLDLLVAAEGYRPAILRGISSDTRIILERFPEIRVRLMSDGPEIPPGYRFRIALRNVGKSSDLRTFTYSHGTGSLDKWLQPSVDAVDVSENGVASLAIDGPGVYTVEVFLRRSVRTGRPVSVPIEMVLPGEITVSSGAAAREFEITVPSETLRRALATASEDR